MQAIYSIKTKKSRPDFSERVQLCYYLKVPQAEPKRSPFFVAPVAT